MREENEKETIDEIEVKSGERFWPIFANSHWVYEAYKILRTMLKV